MPANRKRRLRSLVSSVIPVFIMVRVKQCRPLVGISHLLRIGTTPRHLTLVFSVTGPSASQPMAEARKLIKSRTPTPGNSYVSAVKKSTAPSTQTNPDVSICSSKPPDSIARASPPITNLPISSSPSVTPVSEEALLSPDLTDFKLVSYKKKLKRDSPTKTNHSIAKAEKISILHFLSP
ncbi:hypothetical protein AVEN_151101-1 [Araneus ventricosus]|uniref:Uncharacterized protein n=1 Tax=Araneus ventricosus TaxID=182803 RepID=A0A4Y2Q1E0_ARAVE|nr:hypothetical protein AVEN_151101-1 [Araneus ventricosus]